MTRRYLVPYDGKPPAAQPRLPTDDPRSPSYWLDEAFLRSFSESIMRPWADRYFRAHVDGIEHLPEGRPALLAMNHSGMGWPWDAVVFMHMVARMSAYQRSSLVRGFALPFFFKVPGLGPLILRTGMYPATYRHLARLLGEGELVLYFPEGAEGIGKGWHRRYRLQKFHTSFVKLAARLRAPVLPCVCIGAEELNPLAVNVEAVARATRLPIFPLSPLQLALFPTWLTSALFALPSRLRYVIGEPLLFDIDPERATDDDYRAAADELQALQQAMIDRARSEPAPRPDAPPPQGAPFTYAFGPTDLALSALPAGWPLLYLRFWNAYHERIGDPSGGPAYRAHDIDRLDELAFLLPWAWPLSIARHREAIAGASSLPIDRLLEG